jgi:hypothetical protein
MPAEEKLTNEPFTFGMVSTAAIIALISSAGHGPRCEAHPAIPKNGVQWYGLPGTLIVVHNIMIAKGHVRFRVIVATLALIGLWTVSAPVLA